MMRETPLLLLFFCFGVTEILCYIVKIFTGYKKYKSQLSLNAVFKREVELTEFSFPDE